MDKVLMNHINQMEFFKAWAEPIQTFESVFGKGNREIRTTIKQNFGGQYLEMLDFKIGKFAKKYEETTTFDKWLTGVRKRYTVGSLAFKPTVFLKQLTSIPAYMENVPLGEFFNPVKTPKPNPLFSSTTANFMKGYFLA